MLESLATDNNATMLKMSNMLESGIAEVKQTACDILLDHRLTQKARHSTQKAESVLNRVHVAMPKGDNNVERPPIIPQSVREGM